ncbi:hypothetical protein HYH02_009438 [Chlamydomonas schloesseri]|uniref:Cytochrome P450 n=1 Tax=Chlamydomonas schloesseri TaxID=2026947 RepID=A0A835W742_9CHLO|nr:hypothetical protein HYH02_009438 [Chlamydomonas schloesseri]|eukprot:KAG2443022.1 hypothetical protein HYH02_009438 [Chlamydomonas schloesseri]
MPRRPVSASKQQRGAFALLAALLLFTSGALGHQQQQQGPLQPPAAADPQLAPQHCEPQAPGLGYGSGGFDVDHAAARPPVVGGSRLAATCSGPGPAAAASQPSPPPPAAAWPRAAAAAARAAAAATVSDGSCEASSAFCGSSPARSTCCFEGGCGDVSDPLLRRLQRAQRHAGVGRVGSLLEPPLRRGAQQQQQQHRRAVTEEDHGSSSGSSSMPAAGKDDAEQVVAGALLRRLWAALAAVRAARKQPQQPLPLLLLLLLRNVVLAVLAAPVLLCVVLWLRSLLLPRYDLDAIPGPWPHALPLLGNILSVLRPDFHRVLLRWCDQYGGVVRVKFLWQDGLLVTDPGALASICGRGEGACDKAAAIYTPINAMCTPRGHANLLTSPADESWRAIRKAVAVSFAWNNIKNKFPVIRDRTSVLLEWLRSLGPAASVDVDQAALRVTLDVIGLTAFGHDYGCVRLREVPPEHLIRVLPRAFTEVMRRIANPLRALAPGLVKKGAKGLQSFRDFQAHMQQLLREVLARGPPGPADTDIGAQLWRALDASRRQAERASSAGAGRRRVKPAITEERILSEIGILFVEGFETTGHTISWTLFNIATTPGVQEAVAAELGGLGLLVRPRAMGGRGAAARPLALDDLKRLPYLTACVKEAMRMYPVVSIMGRITQRPTRVGKYLVPAGTPIGTALFAIHNTRHNWSEPEAFRPERWLGVPLETYVADMRSREGITTSTGGTTGTTTGTTTAKGRTGSSSNSPNGPSSPSAGSRHDRSPAAAATAATTSTTATKTGTGKPGADATAGGGAGSGCGGGITVVAEHVLGAPAATAAAPAGPAEASKDDDEADAAAAAAAADAAQRPAGGVQVAGCGDDDGAADFMDASSSGAAVAPVSRRSTGRSISARESRRAPLLLAELESCGTDRGNSGGGAAAVAGGGGSGNGSSGGGNATAAATSHTAAGDDMQQRQQQPQGAVAAAAAAAAAAAGLERKATPPPLGRSVSAAERREAPEEHDWDFGVGGSGRTGISFMPFSEGPRSCVGQSLAKLEVMTVLAMLLSEFRVELAAEMGGREGVRKRESTHLTLQTAGTRGIQMHLHPREDDP